MKSITITGNFFPNLILENNFQKSSANLNSAEKSAPLHSSKWNTALKISALTLCSLIGLAYVKHTSTPPHSQQTQSNFTNPEAGLNNLTAFSNHTFSQQFDVSCPLAIAKIKQNHSESDFNTSSFYSYFKKKIKPLFFSTLDTLNAVFSNPFSAQPVQTNHALPLPIIKSNDYGLSSKTLVLPPSFNPKSLSFVANPLNVAYPLSTHVIKLQKPFALFNLYSSNNAQLATPITKNESSATCDSSSIVTPAIEQGLETNFLPQDTKTISTILALGAMLTSGYQLAKTTYHVGSNFIAKTINLLSRDFPFAVEEKDVAISTKVTAIAFGVFTGALCLI